MIRFCLKQLVLLVGALPLILAACSGGAATPTMVVTSTSRPTVIATTAPAGAIASPTHPADHATTTSAPAATVLAPSAVGVSTQPTSGSSPAGKVINIEIVEPNKDFNSWTYAPGNMAVHVGGKITWTNAGQAAHTVTADEGSAFDSGALEAKAQFTWTFTKAGTFPYHCTFHPWMKGTITVTG